MAKVAVVTDSTAVLPESVEGVTVVPTKVVIGGETHDDGLGPSSSSEAVVSALSERAEVSTSRPAPAVFGEVYAQLAEQGYDEIVSIHLSAEMSGTFDSARVAGANAPVPVVAVDSRTVGPGLGFAVLAGLEVVRRGGSAGQAAEAARERAEETRSFFYVDTLEYLRRGGRIGAAAALLGSALAVKPLLTIEEGRVVLRERVRTSGRALARLEELAVEQGDGRPVEVVVAHLGAAERAEALVRELSERMADGLAGRDVRCGEIGAVLGAHVGPGMIAVVVAPALS